MCRAAHETEQEMMEAPALGTGGFCADMLANTATAVLNLNPHVHAIMPREGLDCDGESRSVHFVDCDPSDFLFPTKVFAMLMWVPRR